MHDHKPDTSDQRSLADIIRNYDWENTSLGPMSSWPVQLKCAVDMAIPSGAQIVLFCGHDFTAIYNDAYAPTIGAKHPKALGKPAKENWAELWDDLEPLLRRVRDRGETVVAKDRPFYIERSGTPETVYFDISYSPVSDEQGHVLAALCIVNETTERVGYESTLKRMASIISSSEDAILGIDLDMTVTDWNTGAEKLYGFSADEIVGRSVTLLVPDGLPDEEEHILSRIRAGERVETHETVRRHKSGRLLDVSLAVSPIYGSDGTIIGAAKIARDITARKEAERAQHLLIGELNHRVKNVLATVAAIARQTFAGAQDIDIARTAFDARLQSLARAHDLLTRGSWKAASLRTAVSEALSPYPPEQFNISGPDVEVSPKAVVGLALILHELATNAAKYGALGVSSGKVTLSWDVSPSNAQLDLSWQESGGPQVTPPTRRGFGSRLIEALSSGQLGGKVDLSYDVYGVRCMINAPLDTGWSDHDHSQSPI
ncbi:PAS domain S-box protein [Agrobacterium vitis]|uniref:Blue-light-activated histidine kinase n=1 Tax=Agrobacterium vitis TaxID=373 RepID=A0A109CXD2_AGRVI|nr:PAS domain S-box protein [Agrobacterium vitis]KAA3506236.1 PAS domain S-box protein [Agrobacterium vitis]KAA3520665.1 PAS domain S-box protein [Agrobacterium vitis]MBF2712955.1 PAS domain S-box protein [Agrobacterium vitis]MCF1480147.1 PAS domain S-box protein [Agrobacterium vitis]MUO98052.1 PAS domain S-box protein [Agrobacterium vitis]